MWQLKLFSYSLCKVSKWVRHVHNPTVLTHSPLGLTGLQMHSCSVGSLALNQQNYSELYSLLLIEVAWIASSNNTIPARLEKPTASASCAVIRS